MSGRVGALKFALGSLLDLKPVIAIADGVLEATENVRTRGKAITRVLDLTEAQVGISSPVNIAVVHAAAQDEGKELLEKARARFNCNETLFHDLVASLAVHGGPGVLGLISYAL
jgi:fatty acid-binding protein DegV